MNKLILTTVFLLLSLCLYAQNDVKIKELGFTTANLNDFGITYRFGRKSSLWRLNAVSTSLSRRDNSDDNGSNIWTSLGVGAQIGKEWRSLINEKFELRYGVDLSFRYSRSKNEDFDFDTPEEVTTFLSQFYRPGIIAVLGFNFVFTDAFLVGAEFQPALTYSLGKTKVTYPNNPEPDITERSTFDFGFSSDAIRLSLLYRF